MEKKKKLVDGNQALLYFLERRLILERIGNMVWDGKAVSDLIAALLLEVGAVRVSVDRPFKLTSGKSSPIYFDCRRMISCPVAMNIIAGFFQWLIEHHKLNINIIAGGESAGIPFADRLATLTGKPMIYVRKQRHDHGIDSDVEGQVVAGSQTLLVEDMITDGASKLVFVRSLREAGALVEHCFVILDREQGGTNTLKREAVTLHSLTTANSVLDYARRSAKITETDVESALDYLQDPDTWISKNRR